MESSVRAIVIGKPGHYRDSLAALLASIPQLEITLVANSLQSALHSFTPLAADLLLLENDPADRSTETTLDIIISNHPAIKVVSMIDSVRQIQSNQIGSVNLVLPKNISAGDFLRAVRRLIAYHSLPRLSTPCSNLLVR